MTWLEVKLGASPWCGQVVSVLAFYSGDPSSNPADANSISVQIVSEKMKISKKRPLGGSPGLVVMFQRSCVRILVLYTGWTWHFFTLICCKKLYCLFEKTKNKWKRGRVCPIFKQREVRVDPFYNKDRSSNVIDILVLVWSRWPMHKSRSFL